MQQSEWKLRVWLEKSWVEKAAPILLTGVIFLHAQIYNRLQVMAVNFPVAQQQDGSYKTAYSIAGFQ